MKGFIQPARLVATCLAFWACAANAQGTIKVGVIAPFSGPFADSGRQMDLGIKAYLRLHGDRIAGKKVDVLLKDTTGLPEVAKRLAQELVVREKVDFLAGFALTPEALAVAEVATQAKKPMIVMNAATSIITTKSPYIVRVSMTLPQNTVPLANWAIKNGIQSVFTLVADYAPGIDAENAFRKAFTSGGGRIIDSVRTPMRDPEFAPFIQRAKDAGPQAVFVFLPAGQGIGFMKGVRERGLPQAGIKMIATGDVTDDQVLDAMGDVALGMITSFHYSAAHDSPENKRFLKACEEVGSGIGRPNFMAVGAYDGMAAISEVAKKLGGKIDGDRAMEVLKGLRLTSPRGAIAIDRETRDVVQTVYLRRVEKVGDHYYNVEFDKVPDVKDPGK
jgi:branched-chain amino acid transport system substrate-binding protein